MMLLAVSRRVIPLLASLVALVFFAFGAAEGGGRPSFGGAAAVALTVDGLVGTAAAGLSTVEAMASSGGAGELDDADPLAGRDGPAPAESGGSGGQDPAEEDGELDPEGEEDAAEVAFLPAPFDPLLGPGSRRHAFDHSEPALSSIDLGLSKPPPEA